MLLVELSNTGALVFQPSELDHILLMAFTFLQEKINAGVHMYLESINYNNSNGLWLELLQARLHYILIIKYVKSVPADMSWVMLLTVQCQGLVGGSEYAINKSIKKSGIWDSQC